jgi:hypothetical protein
LITVVLSYPNGTRESVLLAGVPRKGELIPAGENPAGPALRVLEVLWLRATLKDPEPDVIVRVRTRDESEA